MKKRIKILIVENDLEIAKELESSLRNKNYDVINVASGESALDIIESYKPSVVIMDIELDGKLDGIETAEIIRSKSKRIPIIYHTAFPELFEKAKETIPTHWNEKTDDMSLDKVLKDIELSLIKSDINYFNIEKDKLIFCVKDENNDQITIDRNSIVAVVSRGGKFSSVILDNGRVINSVLTIKKFIENVGINSLIKINKDTAFNMDLRYISKISPIGNSYLIVPQESKTWNKLLYKDNYKITSSFKENADRFFNRIGKI